VLAHANSFWPRKPLAGIVGGDKLRPLYTCGYLALDRPIFRVSALRRSRPAEHVELIPLARVICAGMPARK